MSIKIVPFIYIYVYVYIYLLYGIPYILLLQFYALLKIALTTFTIYRSSVASAAKKVI